MGVYREFARFYAAGLYPEYSRRMAELLPPVLERFRAKPTTILDLACGEGTFAVIMAQRGFKSNGGRCLIRDAPLRPKESGRGRGGGPVHRAGHAHPLPRGEVRSRDLLV